MLEKIDGRLLEELKNRGQRVAKKLQAAAALYTAKNKDYGNSYIVCGKILHQIIGSNPKLDSPTKWAEIALLVRMIDKLCRVANLRFVADSIRVRDESASQTLQDNSIYSQMWAELVETPMEESE